VNEKDVFTTARELTDPAARSAYLDGACNGDPTLRDRVEALLRAHDQPDKLLDQAAEATIGLESGTPTDDEIPLGFLAPPTRPDALGRLGHYDVLAVLGKGAFGIVFRAFDDVLQRVVAVKVLAPQLAATSPARKRFLREARTSAAIRHEHVVQVHAVEEKPLPYLVMEFIPGETLQQKLDRVGPLDVSETLRIGRQIAEGLAAAHATDLIHRDIKPGNVLLEGGHQKAKITDFGLARAADDASISQSGIIAGTPMYMAPEQALGHKIDQRADLFSLGSVLYQMVAGRPPFRANGTVAVLKRVAEDTPRDIREIIPETPQWLCDIIAKLHAKNPDERFQSAREVSDLLADCEAQLKAGSKLKDYSRIPRGKARPSGRRKWMVATAAVLLPLIALAVTEFAGVTHLFRGRQAMGGASWNGSQADAPPAAIAPFAAAQARAHQEAWAKYIDVPVEFTNSIGMKFRLIPPGEFTMGSSREEIASSLKQGDWWVNERLPGERPPHLVEITRAFYLGQTNVTVGQFRKFVNATGYKTQAEQLGGALRWFPDGHWGMDPDSNWPNPGFAQTDEHPVVCVSWNDAAEFCNWLSKQEEKAYRLSTEAEWEYSCRAGSTTRWSFGDNEGDLFNYGRFGSSLQGPTSPVGGLKENSWGLHDMHGNAWEWCQDVYDANYYRTSPPKDPAGPADGKHRVARGGTFSSPPVICRCAFRGHEDPDHRDNTCGFRVVLQVSPFAGLRTESRRKDQPSSPAKSPFTDADIRRIGALPAAQQIEEVRKDLIRRNPGFDGEVGHKIEDGVVTELKIVTDQVTDIAPIRVFNALRVLDCRGTSDSNGPRGRLADLTPLDGMHLANLTDLNLQDTKVSDAGMVYFKDCKDLRNLSLSYTKVTDAGMVYFKDCKNLTILVLALTKVTDAGLANFSDCKNLTFLGLGSTRVSDAGMIHFKDCKGLTQIYLDRTNVGDACLANFKDIPLGLLWIDHTGITDLTPLHDMPLKEIRLTPKNITRGLDTLREMKNIKTIGIDYEQSWPAAKFWQRHDRGEFGKAALPFTDADVLRIAALPATEQVEEVRKELMKRNPGFDGNLSPTIQSDVVIGLKFLADEVVDISPVRALKGLTSLDCSGTYLKNGKLSDLTPLHGMALTELNCDDTQLADLTALSGMPLKRFTCARTQVSDLRPLKDTPLAELQCAWTKVTDFSRLQGLKLERLQAQGILASDLTPLRGMPLRELDLHRTVGITSIQPLQNMPLEYLNLSYLPVEDLAPLKGMTTLQRLVLHDMEKVADLAALKGLRLNLLDIRNCVQVRNLEPIKGMPLTQLWAFNTGFTDLTPLQDMPLEDARLTPKNVTRGLEVLREMKTLKSIGVDDRQYWLPAKFWEHYDKGDFKDR
jgi:formylglycine-generating enzyme required for sulfatase activity/Leucine-rich repeat (LRR) protein